MANEAEIAAITAAIADNAAGPHSVSVSGQTVVAKSIDELLRAKAHLEEEDASSLASLGIRFIKLVPPGGG